MQASSQKNHNTRQYATLKNMKKWSNICVQCPLVSLPCKYVRYIKGRPQSGSRSKLGFTGEEPGASTPPSRVGFGCPTLPTSSYAFAASFHSGHTGVVLKFFWDALTSWGEAFKALSLIQQWFPKMPHLSCHSLQSDQNIFDLSKLVTPFELLTLTWGQQRHGTER